MAKIAPYHFKFESLLVRAKIYRAMKALEAENPTWRTPGAVWNGDFLVVAVSNDAKFYKIGWRDQSLKEFEFEAKASFEESFLDNPAIYPVAESKIDNASYCPVGDILKLDDQNRLLAALDLMDFFGEKKPNKKKLKGKCIPLCSIAIYGGDEYYYIGFKTPDGKRLFTGGEYGKPYLSVFGFSEEPTPKCKKVQEL
jgi:hypothetical protein